MSNRSNRRCFIGKTALSTVAAATGLGMIEPHAFAADAALAGRQSMLRKDYRSAPVRRIVVLGESNAYGMCASAPENE